MRKWAVIPIMAVCGALAVVGCGAPEAPGTREIPATPSRPAPLTSTPSAAAPEDVAAAKQQLMAEWMELAKSASKEKPNIEQATQVAAKLLALDKSVANRFLDGIEDPAASPFAKILATLSVSSALEPAMVPRRSR